MDSLIESLTYQKKGALLRSKRFSGRERYLIKEEVRIAQIRQNQKGKSERSRGLETALFSQGYGLDQLEVIKNQLEKKGLVIIKIVASSKKVKE